MTSRSHKAQVCAISCSSTRTDIRILQVYLVIHPCMTCHSKTIWGLRFFSLFCNQSPASYRPALFASCRPKMHAHLCEISNLIVGSARSHAHASQLPSFPDRTFGSSTRQTRPFHFIFASTWTGPNFSATAKFGRLALHFSSVSSRSRLHSLPTLTRTMKRSPE